MATTLRTSGIQMGDSIMDVFGSAPSYACRAWVNFNGTGTVAIRSSGNVSSITDNGVGDYTINFTTALPDTNYSVSSSANRNTTSADDASSGNGLWTSSFSYATGSVRVAYVASGVNRLDAVIFNVSVFR